MFDSDSILEKNDSFGARIGFLNRSFAIRFSSDSILYPENRNFFLRTRLFTTVGTVSNRLLDQKHRFLQILTIISFQKTA